MKNKLKKFLGILFRVDVFNRIIVFLSMCLFLILPSFILYNIHDYNNNMTIVMPCLLMLGVLLGTGSLTLYRPDKISWFYFLEVFLVLIIYSPEWYEIPGVHVPYINKVGLFWAEFSYCLIGMFLNLVYFFRFSLRRRKNSLDEGTNHDSFYDFLNARDNNENIEIELEKMTSQSRGRILFRIKQIKFSRLMRLFSALVFIGIATAYLALLARFDEEETIPLFKVALMGIFIIAFLLGASFLFPKDFKYVFYYNAILFSFSMILASQNAKVTPLLAIIALAIVFPSFLLTMIVDGRTWMGAKPD